MELLTVRGYSYTYPKADRPALCNLSFSVNEGEFVLLSGTSGSGKSTLLANLKPELCASGTYSGTIKYQGEPINALNRMQSSCDIGFVMQDIDSQLVTDTVRAELCFGLESLGFPPQVIRRRVAEMASFFGLGRLLDRNVNTLSGGQKQMVNLASVLALSPRLILLDEPTSQLDPVATRDFLSMLIRLNRELGLTVMIAEHNIEALLAHCDHALVLENGSLSFSGSGRETAHWMAGRGAVFSRMLPAAARIFADHRPIPLTVSEGRTLFEEKMQGKPPAPLPPGSGGDSGTVAVHAKRVYFGHNGAQELIFKDLDFTAHQGEITALMGDNGSGKTTLLKLLCAILKPNRGKVTLHGKQGKAKAVYLPQNTKLLFVHDTVFDDLMDTARANGAQNAQYEVEQIAKALYISSILTRHPYDVSEGERQRAALAKVLLARPGLVLLDEPTKALDAHAKGQLAVLLKQLAGQEVTIIMASHDVEFCAEHCDRCALLFDGGVACTAPPKEFFGGNTFYTTPASLIAGDYRRHAVTCKEVERLWEE